MQKFDVDISATFIDTFVIPFQPISGRKKGVIAFVWRD
ncbi:hypothetical protein UYSO10_1431 [Kosakonia radicincitans]|nr:hypothetical protein UYSO10_1431 [Kosakonia radicincitans]